MKFKFHFKFHSKAIHLLKTHFRGRAKQQQLRTRFLSKWFFTFCRCSCAFTASLSHVPLQQERMTRSWTLSTSFSVTDVLTKVLWRSSIMLKPGFFSLHQKPFFQSVLNVCNIKVPSFYGRFSLCFTFCLWLWAKMGFMLTKLGRFRSGLKMTLISISLFFCCFCPFLQKGPGQKCYNPFVKWVPIIESLIQNRTHLLDIKKWWK